MFNWYTEKKEEKSYKSDMLYYTELRDDLETIIEKIKEVHKADLGAIEKEPLIELLEAQLQTIRDDISIFGLSMSKYYDTFNKMKNRNIPISAEVLKISTKNYSSYFKLSLNETSFSTSSKALADTFCTAITSDSITKEKIDTIKRVHLNKKIKGKLTIIQENFKAKRKMKLDSKVQDYKSSIKDENIAEVEKLAITESYTTAGYHAKIFEISSEISSIKQSYEYNVSDENGIEKIFKVPLLYDAQGFLNEINIKDEVKEILKQRILEIVFDERALPVYHSLGTSEFSN